ncbi:MAG: ACP S-malonyltransferase, partial [Gammaproteobacteria bacterium]
GQQASMMAGHSLGEYTALVCAGVIDFAAAVKLVEYRGQAMQEAVPKGTGAMAAILGLDDEQVIQACGQAAGDEVVSAVNFNSPGQVVIAGQAAAVERAIEIAKQMGARKAIPLPVSVPSHCALMQSAADKLAVRLEEVEFKPATMPVVQNVEAQVSGSAAEIRSALVRQLYLPVRWVECVQYMASHGVDSLLECGPGKVLAGLNRRIDRGMGMHPVYDSGSLQAALEKTATGNGNE